MQVGPWQLDIATRTLRDGAEERPLAGPAVRVLELLMERAPEPVSTDELLERGWPGRVVNDNSVHQCISQLRKALRHPQLRSDVIKTIVRFGYQWLGTTLPSTPAQHPPRVAVLIFDDVSDADSRLGLAMTMEVRGALASLSGIRVEPMVFARRAIAESRGGRASDSGISYVLGGTVSRDGLLLRVTAELDDTRSETLVWSKSYAGSAEDLFRFQSDIAHAVAAHVGLEITRAEFDRLGRRPVAGLGPFELTARAVDLFWNLSRPHYGRRDMENAVTLARQVLRDEQDYVTGQALLAQLLYQHAVQMAYPGFRKDVAMVARKARHAIVHAPYQADVLFPAGWLLAHIPESRDHGLRTAERAMQLAPNDVWSLAQMSSLLVRAGRIDEGEAIADAQMADDFRLDDWNQMAKLLAATLRGDYVRAVAIAEPYVESHPTFIWYRMLLANAFGMLGHRQAARLQVEETLRLSPRFTPAHWRWIKDRHVWNQPQTCYVGLDKAGLL